MYQEFRTTFESEDITTVRAIAKAVETINSYLEIQHQAKKLYHDGGFKFIAVKNPIITDIRLVCLPCTRYHDTHTLSLFIEFKKAKRKIKN